MSACPSVFMSLFLLPRFLFFADHLPVGQSVCPSLSYSLHLSASLSLSLSQFHIIYFSASSSSRSLLLIPWDKSVWIYVMLACLPVCLSVYLSICVYVCLSFWLLVCMSAYLLKCLYVCLSVCLSICLSICLYINNYTFVCQSVHLSVRLPSCPVFLLSVCLVLSILARLYAVHLSYQSYLSVQRKPKLSNVRRIAYLLKQEPPTNEHVRLAWRHAYKLIVGQGACAVYKRSGADVGDRRKQALEGATLKRNTNPPLDVGRTVR